MDKETVKEPFSKCDFEKSVCVLNLTKVNNARK